jgi:5-methyltetrahydrofolate--homocysteine methyltransferase
MNELSRLTGAIESGDQEAAGTLTRRAIEARTDPGVLLDAMVAGMDRVGERFRRREAFVPEMMIAARAMKAAMSEVEPLLVEAGLRPEHSVVIGTVDGDLHDIGKNLVAMMWRGAHLEVVDLGVNVAPRRFAEAVQEHGAAVVGLSTLLTTTMPAMAEAVEVIRTAADAGVKVVVGGAPVTPDYAVRIGADAFAPDAAAAVDVVRKLIRP